MKKAYLVCIAPMVRVVADENATEEEVIALAVEKMRNSPNEYLHPTHCEGVREDTECPYNPEQAIKKYCTENVANFAPRYDLALDTENRMRCSLQYADSSLYNDLNDRMIEWCEDNDEDPDDYNIEDIF